MGGWSRKWQFSLTLFNENGLKLRRGWVVLKCLKTPLCNIKMVPCEVNLRSYDLKGAVNHFLKTKKCELKLYFEEIEKNGRGDTIQKYQK